MTRKVLWWLAAGAVLGTASCGGKESDSDVLVTAAPAVEAKVDFPAEIDKLDLGDKETKAKGLPLKPFTVEANWKFSPDKVGRLSLLFIVDLSGSMEENDPLTDGDCQRHKAIKALAASLKDKMKAGDAVDVAVVGFSDQSMVLSGSVPVESFLTNVGVGDLCQQLRSTNYEAAFKEAATLAAGMTTAGQTQAAPVAAYFITDGLPTSGRDPTLAAATTLRDELKKVHPDSTLSAVFLGIQGGLSGSIFVPGMPAAGGPPAISGPVTTGPGSVLPGGITYLVDDGLDEISRQAIALLGEITGDPARVKAAASAADLAAQLASFERPKPGLDEDSVKVKIDDSRNPRELICKQDASCKITKLAAPDVGWQVTVTFPMLGSEGREIPNTAEITGKRTDGQLIRAKATVHFKSIR